MLKDIQINTQQREVFETSSRAKRDCGKSERSKTGEWKVWRFQWFVSVLSLTVREQNSKVLFWKLKTAYTDSLIFRWV